MQKNRKNCHSKVCHDTYCDQLFCRIFLRQSSENNRKRESYNLRKQQCKKKSCAAKSKCRSVCSCHINNRINPINIKEKRQKEQKAKQVKVNVKEIRFGPQTDDHDYNFKLKHAKGFLEDGDKVKAYVFFKGRSILFKEQGEVLLLRFANDLEDYAKVDQMPVLEGKRMTIQLSPKKKEAPKKPVVAKPAAPAQKAEMPKTDAE